MEGIVAIADLSAVLVHSLKDLVSYMCSVLSKHAWVISFKFVIGQG